MVTKALMLDETGKEMVESLDRIAEALTPSEETVEGNPVTFDSPFEQDAKSVVVSVKPIQDLHGYDHPWVGGAYKNKLPLTVAEIKALNTIGTWSGNTYTLDNTTFEVNEDDNGYVTEIKANGTPTNNILYFRVAQNISVASPLIFSTGYTDTWEVNGHVMEMVVDNTSYKPSDVSGVEIPTGTYELHIAVAAGRAINNNYKPMLRPTTVSDYSYAPYSNICPISGIDEVEIEVSGKNLLNYAEFHRIDPDTQIQNNQWAVWDNYIACEENETVTVNCGIGNVTIYRFFARCYDAQKNFIGQVTATYIPSNNYTFTINVPGAKYFRFQLYHSSSLADYDFSHAQLEHGSVATSFEPYNSNSHTTTIPLPSTLYDADVDVTSGDADSRFGYSKVIGANSGSNRLNGDFYGNINDLTNVKSVPNNLTAGNALCNIARNVSAEERFNATDCCIAVRTNGQIDICISGITSQEDLNTYLAEHDVYVCYELATPTTISFDPTDVELLEGTNVVSTNGEKVAVTYGRSLWQDIDDLKTDTEGKLNKSDVADVEGDTASKAYSVNDFMLRADGLYKVTAPIASGASITSSNTTKTTVGEVLTALLNA